MALSALCFLNTVLTSASNGPLLPIDKHTNSLSFIHSAANLAFEWKKIVT